MATSAGMHTTGWPGSSTLTRHGVFGLDQVKGRMSNLYIRVGCESWLGIWELELICKYHWPGLSFKQALADSQPSCTYESRLMVMCYSGGIWSTPNTIFVTGVHPPAILSLHRGCLDHADRTTPALVWRARHESPFHADLACHYHGWAWAELFLCATVKQPLII